ncbi:restriction endonuclease subunit S [Chryseobacterium jejuense]|uniref:Restriction endonuclease S subunit n=1 Tax=Chryseobacterium jejuense TaxID=445960 RepID=A0A2X2V9X6_CHRJE|nr:restriction endonuclease subunit S [Chryseobacterium jejuense]SDI85295.1 Restriction endonuclease S subunit [Chryseobacterium jejuense]SQB27612.1 Type I restriction enzyme EcoKI specificity protein [Chryseobacterium jejuense]
MREDWIECKLGEVLFLTSDKYKGSGGDDIFYIGLEHIEKNLGILTNNVGVEKIFTDKNKFHPNQILYGKLRPYLNKCYLSKESGVCSTDILVFDISKAVNSKLIHLYMLSRNFVNEMSNNTSGVNLPRVSTKFIQNYILSLPPLPEQRAIVKKLESLFSSLDAGVTDLKKVQQQLKIYRQAVLKKAFEGEEKEQELINISDAIGGFAFKSPDFLEKGIYQVIRIGNVRPDLIRLDSNPVFVNKLTDKTRKYLLKENDIVISLTGTRNKRDYGFAAVIKNENLLLNQRLAAIRFNQDCNPKYYLHYFSTDYFKDDFFSAETGNTGQGNVGMNAIKETLVPFPLLSVQNEIVKQIESRLSVCDSIEQNIKESLEKAEALRQSILKKAFEGNLLTAQELAECKLATDYEPASVLLERIKTEQTETKVKSNKKKVVAPVVVTKKETPIVKVSADIHAGLIAKVVKIHEENPNSLDKLSHIKCEKISHLVEYHLQIPLGRQPVKDAAGPDDYPHLKKVEHRAKMAGYFAVEKKPIGYSYSSGKNSDKAIAKLHSAISIEKNEQLDALIALFLNFDLEAAEIIATTYAGWNNLILSGNTNPSDEGIVYESRENWSERKLKIARDRFFKAIEWMRKNDLIPIGYGTIVPFPKKKKS